MVEQRSGVIVLLQMDRMGFLHTDKQAGRLHGAQLDQGDRLANHNNSSVRLHILVGDGKAMVNIFCTLYQHPHMDHKRALPFPSEPHPGTWEG